MLQFHSMLLLCSLDPLTICSALVARAVMQLGITTEQVQLQR